jgi:membrane-associated phospholipid phosphatase
MTTRTALLPFSLYLVLTFPLVAFSVGGGGLSAWVLPVVHLATALGLLGLVRLSSHKEGPAPEPDSGTPPPAVRWEWIAWVPLLLVPFLYWELPVLNQTLVQGYLDSGIQNWEDIIFPSDPSRNLAGAIPRPILSEGLHLAYLSYYPLIAVPPLVLWVWGSRVHFRESVFRLSLTFGICFLFFIILPVEGPRYGGVPPLGIPDGSVRGLALFLLEAGSSRGTAFPSSHVAVAFTQALFLWTVNRWVGLGAVLLSGCLALGAVYGGFHYGVDSLAGGVLAGVLFVLVKMKSWGNTPPASGVTLGERTP